MDFSKLSSSEKMAVYASVAVVILAVYSLAYGWGGLMALPLIGGLAVLAIIFLPQMSPSTSLPGSRGSLLLLAGGTVAIFWALNTLVWLGHIFRNLDEIDTWIYLVGLAAALWLGWQAWQAFKAEGGNLRLGSAAGGTASPGASTAPAADDDSPRADAEPTTPSSAAEGAEPATPAAPPAAPPPAVSAGTAPDAEPAPEAGVDDDEEDRPQMS